jgi:hypothetical protein
MDEVINAACRSPTRTGPASRPRPATGAAPSRGGIFVLGGLVPAAAPLQPTTTELGPLRPSWATPKHKNPWKRRVFQSSQISRVCCATVTPFPKVLRSQGFRCFSGFSTSVVDTGSTRARNPNSLEIVASPPSRGKWKRRALPCSRNGPPRHRVETCPDPEPPGGLACPGRKPLAGVNSSDEF